MTKSYNIMEKKSYREERFLGHKQILIVSRRSPPSLDQVSISLTITMYSFYSESKLNQPSLAEPYVNPS